MDDIERGFTLWALTIAYAFIRPAAWSTTDVTDCFRRRRGRRTGRLTAEGAE